MMKSIVEENLITFKELEQNTDIESPYYGQVTASEGNSNIQVIFAVDAESY